MKYVNKMTGASIDIPCELHSDIWELVETPAPVIVEEKADDKPVKTKKTIKK